MKKKYFSFFALLLIIINPHYIYSQVDGSGDQLGDYFSACMAGNCPSIPIGNPAGPPGSYTFFDKAFSAYVGGDFYVPSTGGGETEGKLAIGGNLTLEKTGYTIGASGGGSTVVGPQDYTDTWATNNFDDDNLIVGGNVGGNTTNYIGGDAIVGGSLLGTTGLGQSYSAYDFTQTGVGINNVGVDFSSVNNYLYLRSLTFAGETVTGTYSNSWGSYDFVGDGTSLMQVFEVNEDLSGWGISFTNVPSNATILINISGSNRSWGITNYATGANRENILLNFFEATTVNLSGEIDAAVLIPLINATTNLTGNLHGRLLTGGDFNHIGGGIEIHNYPFAGYLPDIDETSLPLNLLEFSCIKKGDKVNLNWITSNESRFAYFELEKSTNGQDFTFLSHVESAPTISVLKRYSYFDQQTETSSHKLYYRLKQVDEDGSYTYSKTIFVENSQRKCNLLSNTISDNYLNLHFSSFSSQKVKIIIYDIQGTQIKSMEVNIPKGLSNHQINLCELAKGIYLFRVQSACYNTSKKIHLMD